MSKNMTMSWEYFYDVFDLYTALKDTEMTEEIKILHEKIGKHIREKAEKMKAREEWQEKRANRAHLAE